jgi:hypothetical protein
MLSTVVTMPLLYASVSADIPLKVTATSDGVCVVDEFGRNLEPLYAREISDVHSGQRKANYFYRLGDVRISIDYQCDCRGQVTFINSDDVSITVSQDYLIIPTVSAYLPGQLIEFVHFEDASTNQPNLESPVFTTDLSRASRRLDRKIAIA